MIDLAVVMPVYNEQASIEAVVNEWLAALRRIVGSNFVMCAINDGSIDGSLETLRELARRNVELKVIDKPNSGHGQTCLVGYRWALSNGAEWIFQMDSDGQCDPAYFPLFWEKRTEQPLIYGYRRIRDDGRVRFLISRVVSLTTWLGTGVWVPDANVPYRLMDRRLCEVYVERIPSDFYLSNVLLSALQAREHRIHWIDIRFRQRHGGVTSLRYLSFAKFGAELLSQLWGLGGARHDRAGQSAPPDRPAEGRREEF